ncbi:hypothetical protein EDD64_12512 [Effusibacillus lacus]|nr:hypothetical protein EDD64_12512 [Effusibacillus lacus]
MAWKLDRPWRRVNLSFPFVKSGTGRMLRCLPAILHWGKRTIVSECKILNEQDQLVATAMGTFIVSEGGGKV